MHNKKFFLVILILALFVLVYFFAIKPESDDHLFKGDAPKLAVVEEPFILKLGESVQVNETDFVKFLKVKKGVSGTCGDDVQTCPDSIVLNLYNVTTGANKEFSLAGRFYPYKIGQVDIVLTKMIDDNTYEFKISPTKF